MAGPLTDDEQRLLAELLRRVCEHHVDQFQLLRIRTRYGPHYVTISNGLERGVDPEHYAWFPDLLLFTQPESMYRNTD